MYMKITIATHNQHKRDEFIALASYHKLDLALSMTPVVGEPCETGTTFIENALIKAKDTIKAVAGQYVLAEDSGLCVPSLGGRPGLYSARFAGEAANSRDNILHLQALLSDEAKTQAVPAYYYAMIVILRSPTDQQPIIQEGVMNGKVLVEPQEDIDGFGYDPIFIPDGEHKTLNRLPKQFKNAHSHRSKAFLKAIQALTKE